jgi:hypothetical protein
MKTLRCISFASIAVVSVACSSNGGQPVDIGNRNTGVIGEKLSDFSGHWDGYAEAYEFEPGSDRVRVTLDANGDGTVRFGDADPPPIPSDITVRYPPETGWYPKGQSISQYYEQSQAGFEYPIHSLSLTEKRLRFELQPADMVDPWCNQEPSLPAPNVAGGFRCFGENGVTTDPATGACTFVFPTTGETIPVDCSNNAVNNCSMLCDCDVSGCTAHPIEVSHFDGALESEGTEFVGTLAFPGGSGENRLIVRLTRQTP